MAASRPPSSPDSVEAARERGDVASALSLALEAWRSERDPSLADVVDVLSAEAGARFDVPAGVTARAFQGYWARTARSRDPVAVGWAATSLRARLPATAAVAGWLRARIATLAALPADPRFTHAIVELLTSMPFPLAAEDAYADALALACALLDVRAVAWLRALRDGPRARSAANRDWLVARLPAAIRRLEREVSALPPSPARDAWRALAAKWRPLATDPEGELLARVREEPDDDGARLVYADWLQERGHPLGELIVLQCAPSLTAAQRARERSILHRHARAWLGELGQVLVHPRFERGFLASARLARNSAATPDAWLRAASDPRLATVHTLERGQASIARYTSFLVSPVTRNVRHVDVPRAAVLGALLDAGFPRRLSSLALPRRPRREELAAMATRFSLASLDVVLRPGEAALFFEDLAAAGMTPRLTRVNVRPSSPARAGVVLAEVRAHASRSLGEVTVNALQAG